jgi:hypothetical protein
MSENHFKVGDNVQFNGCNLDYYHRWGVSLNKTYKVTHVDNKLVYIKDSIMNGFDYTYFKLVEDSSMRSLTVEFKEKKSKPEYVDWNYVRNYSGIYEATRSDGLRYVIYSGLNGVIWIAEGAGMGVCCQDTFRNEDGTYIFQKSDKKLRIVAE